MELEDDSETEETIQNAHNMWKKNAHLLYDSLLYCVRPSSSYTVQWSPMCDTHTRFRDNPESTSPKRRAFSKEQSTKFGYCRDDLAPPVSLKDVISLPHSTTVTKARFMPSSHGKIVASRGHQDRYIYITDVSKKSVGYEENPAIVLKGHKKEGDALSWHPEHNQLLTGASDCLVCHWDISTCASGNVEPIKTYNAHVDAVNDVQWNFFCPNVFASASESNLLAMHDVRSRDPTCMKVAAHEGGINCISFNRFEEHYLITGGGDKWVHLWDDRLLAKPLGQFQHLRKIEQLQFSPFSSSVFAVSAGKHIYCWNMAKKRREMDTDLVFVHKGHIDCVTDFDWDPNEEWTIASVALDSTCQVWQVAQGVLTQ